ncbi:Superoxide dismutase [Cu-Zn], partial [Toxocara canis]
FNLFPADDVIRAISQIRSEYDDVKGVVTFHQQHTANSPCTIRANITGLSGEHGFAILDWGNMVSGCYSLGNTFNPDRVSHAPFEHALHRVGTLGNIIDGQYEDENNRYVTLYGRNSVIGRGIAVFENPDDGATKNTAASRFNGDVGAPIACGIIGRVGGEF